MLNYDEALNIILKKQSLGIKPGLSRITDFLSSIGSPQNKLNIIHIAGTNGKGTVANTISAALINNGCKVGLFTSPWIVDYREQIQVNGEFIDKAYFADFIEKYADCPLTEFEFVTAMMYSYFDYMGVDYAVVECGMGGRGDATNVERNNIAVLTSISLDHTDFLGNTVEEITFEKEGIIRPDCPCFRYCDTGDFDADNLSLARSVIRHLGLDDNINLVKPVARQQRVGGILLDGGHNLQAGKALSKIIDNEIALIGMMRDKDIDGYLSYVAPKCSKIICTDVNNPRAVDAAVLAQLAKKYCSDVEIVDSPANAIERGGVTLVCGSFYMIREIINSLL